MSAPKPRGDSIDLQARDIALLRGLFECRVMTKDHATGLYFEGKGEAAKKRLQKLKAAKLIADRPRKAFEPSILFLTRDGLDLLQKRGVLNDYPAFDLPALDRRARVSDLTIRHELEVMDVRTAFHAAIKSVANFTIAEFSTWPLLNEFMAYRPGQDGMKVLVKPDGFIRIHETEANGGKFERTFFLEVDRSSEVQDRLVAKVACYFEHYKSGSFAVRNGAPRDDYKQFPFRVLIVFKSAERRNNTAERLLQANLPIFKQVCLATLEDVIRDPLGAIWINPADYRDVTKGTLFDVERLKPSQGYRPQPERETLVETKVKKFSLLES